MAMTTIRACGERRRPRPAVATRARTPAARSGCRGHLEHLAEGRQPLLKIARHRSSPNSLRSRPNARDSRDFTVPRRHPSAVGLTLAEPEEVARRDHGLVVLAQNADRGKQPARRSSSASADGVGARRVALGDGGRVQREPGPTPRRAAPIAGLVGHDPQQPGRNGAPARKRPSASHALTNPSCAGLFRASAADPVIEVRSARRERPDEDTSAAYASSSPDRAASIRRASSSSGPSGGNVRIMAVAAPVAQRLTTHLGKDDQRTESDEPPRRPVPVSAGRRHRRCRHRDDVAACRP